jgi:hypothetical protein
MKNKRSGESGISINGTEGFCEDAGSRGGIASKQEFKVVYLTLCRKLSTKVKKMVY